MSDDRKDILPLLQEHASVSTERRITGRVRVSTRTEEVETPVPVDLSEVDVDVVRVPVDRPVDEAPQIITEGDVTIIPVVEERLIVQRQLYVREEIHIRRTERHETAEIPITTRKQTASIERLPSEEDATSSSRTQSKET
ncbi:DUF2382 domain-containing protein [Falsirhodobacter algicola]|uniref:DUF2382 domain-containing protein n=1 Tax=Falsirhodobacter algicola TaxID=2692330 RepID=A0A8J8MSK6_9RHOB|nr:DUF2382 domain-containing protein [Falsirhodobacter algicola]QUS35692.1 DUF2382 domain-containing protein [Falsirhodobacter algicola]